MIPEKKSRLMNAGFHHKRLWPWLGATGLALLVGSWSSSAYGWVCTRAVDNESRDTGPSLSWYTRGLTYTLHSAGTAKIDNDVLFKVLQQSFRVWEGGQERDGIEGCEFAGGGRSDILFKNTPAFSSVDRLGYNYLDPDDNENLIIFRDTAWPHSGQGGNIIALTTTTYKPLTGELIDADIEFNTHDFTFTTDGEWTTMDLMNTAVHEIGHFIGLAHTQVSGATMVAQASEGDMDKRDLACDDRNAVVFKYPLGGNNGYCSFSIDASCGDCAPPGTLKSSPTVSVVSASDGTGCQSAGAPALPVLLWLLASVVVGKRRRQHSG